MKGLSLNVTLSEEQIEQIASLSADKVNETKNYSMQSEEYYKQEIQRKDDQINRLNQMIVQREFTSDRLKKPIDYFIDKYEPRLKESE